MTNCMIYLCVYEVNDIRIFIKYVINIQNLGSLRTNLPYLFTYKNYKNLSISNRTNEFEGGVFSCMKNMISLHRGLVKE